MPEMWDREKSNRVSLATVAAHHGWPELAPGVYLADDGRTYVEVSTQDALELVSRVARALVTRGRSGGR